MQELELVLMAYFRTLLMEGSDVLKLQEALKKAGFAVSTDGVFGPGTDKAVKEFQQKKSLTADGIVGAKTLALMA